MKKIIFVLLGAMAINFCSAQEIEWQNTIGGSGSDVLTTLAQTNDNGFILGGYSISDVSGDKNENSNGSCQPYND